MIVVFPTLRSLSNREISKMKFEDLVPLYEKNHAGGLQLERGTVQSARRKVEAERNAAIADAAS